MTKINHIWHGEPFKVVLHFAGLEKAEAIRFGLRNGGNFESCAAERVDHHGRFAHVGIDGRRWYAWQGPSGAWDDADVTTGHNLHEGRSILLDSAHGHFAYY